MVECGRDATDENIQRVQALVEATLAVGAGLAILSSAATASTTASAAARRSGGEETEAGTDVICTDEDGVACTDEAGAAGTIGQKEDSKAAGKVSICEMQPSFVRLLRNELKRTRECVMGPGSAFRMPSTHTLPAITMYCRDPLSSSQFIKRLYR